MSDAESMHPVSILSPGHIELQETHRIDNDPAYFADLAVDYILDAVTKEFEAYDLRSLYRYIPHQQDVIAYRQATLLDLSSASLSMPVRNFAAAMIRVRALKELAKKCFNKYQAAAYILAAINKYCTSVRALETGLAAANPKSEGLQALLAALHDYIISPSFEELAQGAMHHRTALDTIRYTVLIHEGSVTVREFVEEPAYNTTIAQFFARFQQGDETSHGEKATRDLYMGNVQGRILDGVAQLNPEVFSALSAFVEKQSNFIDPILSRFEREVQFYLAWLAFTDRLATAGLEFSLPRLITDYRIGARAGFDLALAEKLRVQESKIVTNDFYLDGAERIFVVSGPNQGGKTTFARMIGQMHYFANLGLTVPGCDVRLKFFDRIFTHFEREEALTTLHGKLYDDLTRIHAILESATADSLIILNEIFNSTALKDALFLADAVLRRIIKLGALGVCVTFMDELATLGPETVSVTSMVEPDNPAKRSFRVVRRPADGLAYALSIAKKYSVTYERLKERLA